MAMFIGDKLQQKVTLSHSALMSDSLTNIMNQSIVNNWRG